MIKIAKRQYHVQAGEKITLSTQASGTAHVVNFEFDNGEKGVLIEGQPLTFPVMATRVLTLLFTFSNSSNGKYVIALSGDQGGSDTDNVDQQFGIPTTMATYRFQV